MMRYQTGQPLITERAQVARTIKRMESGTGENRSIPYVMQIGSSYEITAVVPVEHAADLPCFRRHRLDMQPAETKRSKVSRRTLRGPIKITDGHVTHARLTLSPQIEKPIATIPTDVSFLSVQQMPPKRGNQPQNRIIRPGSQRAFPSVVV